ncbi:uncharacterized protein [Onthophagus taurus]|uniref:uncharacterized protein isoform X3 n=1 Tax=Onthophagus taurus TaxID=166361 RepID=UPI0039BEA570
MSECNEFVCIIKENPDGTTTIRKFKFECEVKDESQKSEPEETKKEEKQIISRMEVYDSEWDDDVTITKTSNTSFVNIANPSSSQCISNRPTSPFRYKKWGRWRRRRMIRNGKDMLSSGPHPLLPHQQNQRVR